MVLFAVSAQDAHNLHKEFHPLKVTDFTDLDTGRVIARLQGQGKRNAALRLVLPNLQVVYGRGDKVRKRSRLNFGKDVLKVEANILACYGNRLLGR